MFTEFPFCHSTRNTPARELLTRISHILDHENGPWVAGGAVRRILTKDHSSESDIDVFFANEAQRKLHTPALREIERVWRKERGDQAKQWFVGEIKTQTSDDHGLAFSREAALPPLQLIRTHYYASPEDLINDIDFTICQMVTDGVTVRCPHRSINDLSERRLKLNTNSSVRNPSRILRYFSYGFEPDESVLGISDIIPKSFYDPNLGTMDGFDGVIAELMNSDITTDIMLGKVASLHITKSGNQSVAYLHGFPIPTPIAYLFIVSQDMRTQIMNKMLPVWQKNNLGPILYIEKPQITPEHFFKVYRAAI